jgi:hypothetical protein
MRRGLLEGTELLFRFRIHGLLRLQTRADFRTIPELDVPR